MRRDLVDIADVIARVLDGYDVNAAYIFGSTARGDSLPTSDIDLRLECGPSMTYGTLYEISQALSSALGREVEIVTNPPQHMRPSFRKRIAEDEVLVYEAA